MIDNKGNVISKAYFKDGIDRKKALAKVRSRRKKYLDFSRYVGWGRRNKEKVAVQNKTRSLIMKGVVVKPVCCEVCGLKKDLVVHHVKYTLNPKDWLFVCHKCHNMIHGRIKR